MTTVTRLHPDHVDKVTLRLSTTSGADVAYDVALDTLIHKLRQAGYLIESASSQNTRPLRLGMRVDTERPRIDVRTTTEEDTVVGTLDENAVVTYLRNFKVIDRFRNSVRHMENTTVQDIDTDLRRVLIKNDIGQTIASIDLDDLFDALAREGFNIRSAKHHVEPIPIGAHVRTLNGDIGFIADRLQDTYVVVILPEPGMMQRPSEHYHRNQLRQVRQRTTWENVE